MPRFAVNDYARAGRIDCMTKDLDGTTDLARQKSGAMPLTAPCAGIHRLLTAAGMGGEDKAAPMEFFNGPENGAVAMIAGIATPVLQSRCQD